MCGGKHLSVIFRNLWPIFVAALELYGTLNCMMHLVLEHFGFAGLVCCANLVACQAMVTREDNNEIQMYVGLTAGRLKTRFNNQCSSFKDTNKKHTTELSKYIWSLKESNVPYSIRWKILRKCNAYSNKIKRCNLCLHEKCLFTTWNWAHSIREINLLLHADTERYPY